VTTRISRRHLLRGAGGVAVGLPLLEAMGDPALFTPRRAFGATGARRLVVFYTPNGFIQDRWRPTGTETSFTMGSTLAPLEPHKRELILLDGIQTKRAGGDAHTDGVAGMLTGTPLVNRSASGISVDQVVADAIGMGTKFKSYEFAAARMATSEWGRMSFRGPGQHLTAVHEPARAFRDLFSEPVSPSPSSGDGAPLARLREQRQSVLDLLKEDHASLARKVSTADRAVLDQHLTALRGLEQSLAALTSGGAGCQAPPNPGTIVAGGLSDATNYPVVGQIMLDMMVMALACERTRVASMMWEHSSENRRFAFAGANVEHHNAAHGIGGGAADVAKIDNWFARKFETVIAKMKSIREGAGTMLDNSLVVWVSDMGNGNHSDKGAQFILAGSAGGYFTTGRWLRYTDNPPRNNVLVSILNAFGIPKTTFGTPEWCTGPLARLKA
jgi:hypothetical protein